MRTFDTPEALEAEVGKEVCVSDWLTISQERVNKFAEATDDPQWIHVDIERAKRESPFGGTIAHGFLTLSETADILYKTTDFYMPAAEHCIAWNDPHLGIDWPLSAPALLSPKDAVGKSLQDSEVFP